MRIGIVLNKANRELPSMKRIRRWVEELGSGNHVLIVDFHDPRFHLDLLDFAPQAVLTFPFTSVGLSHPFAILKQTLGCFIVCLRCEGVINFDSPQQILWMAGMDRYSRSLVDYEIAWGPATARILKRVLLEQEKLTESSRVLEFGHAGLESFFEGAPGEQSRIPAQVLSRLRSRQPRDVVLFITGFQLANYTDRDLVLAGDIVRQDDPEFESKFVEAVRGVERAFRFRAAWIEMVLRAAKENPGTLFVVKGHPIEAEQHLQSGVPSPYGVFDGVDNIVHFFDEVTIGDLLPHCGLFLHYGSTCASEAYLLGIPSVFVTSKEVYGSVTSPSPYDFSDLGWPSSWRVDVVDGPALVHRHLNEGLPEGEGNEKMSKVMREVFAITGEHVSGARKYRPSRDIALFLLALEGRTPQRVEVDDPHLRQAVSACGLEMLQHCGDPALRDTYRKRLGL